jgi:hypothetical protein
VVHERRGFPCRKAQSRLPKRRAWLKKLGDGQSPKKKRIISGSRIASSEPCGVELTDVTLNVSRSIQVDDLRTGLTFWHRSFTFKF